MRTQQVLWKLNGGKHFIVLARGGYQFTQGYGYSRLRSKACRVPTDQRGRVEIGFLAAMCNVIFDSLIDQKATEQLPRQFIDGLIMA
jgi:hypothetical protein